MTTLTTFPSWGAPAFLNAIVHGDLPDFVAAVRRSGLLEGTRIPAKKTRPLFRVNRSVVYNLGRRNWPGI